MSRPLLASELQHQQAAKGGPHRSRRDGVRMRKGLPGLQIRLWTGLLFALFAGSWGCSGGSDLPVEIRELTEESEAVKAQLLERAPLYIVGPGDLFRITYLGENLLDSNIRVNPDGRLMAPLLDDPILAAGLTVEQLKVEIESRLRDYLVDPQIFLHQLELGSQHVFVLGQVRNPHLATAEPLTLAGVISACGGITRDAQKKQILVIRKTPEGNPVVFDVKFNQLLEGRSILPDIPLQRYDVVVVPRSRVAKMRDFMNAAFGNNMVALRFGIDATLLQDALSEKLDLYYNNSSNN